MMNAHTVKTNTGTEISDPPIARLVFSDTRFSVVWLVIRVLLGITWVQAALHKLSDPGWMETGAALKGFWTAAVTPNAKGATPVAFDWYKGFLQGLIDSGSYVWFAKLVAFGELAIGVALIIGMFVGIAAFFGGFLNWNFLMAGTASSNGLLFAAAILLILAWKTAGYWGLDRYLLPRLGTPWMFGRRSEAVMPPAPKQPASTT